MAPGMHVLLLGVAAHAAAAASAAQVVLQDARVRAGFAANPADGATFGRLVWLSAAGAKASLVHSSGAPPAWLAGFVTPTTEKPIQLDSGSAEEGVLRSIVGQPTADHLELQWSFLPVADAGLVNVSLAISLVDGLLHQRISFASNSNNVGLWQWTLRPAGAVLLPPGSAVFENMGFGVLHQPPSSFEGEYPRATLQFMAALGPAGARHAGVYVAAHDAGGAAKTFSCYVHHTASFSVSALPPDAGLPLAQRPYTLEYPLVVTVFDGDWWDAAQLYRAWSLREASWTRQGPMSTRSDVAPWLYNITTWVNSHWQENDVFNTSGGDPAVVQSRVERIQARFGLEHGSLALHWYEWDTLGYAFGSNYSKCETEVTCGFDTHYPEYFPVREGFEQSLQAMQAVGVRVAPYINGRIFDKATRSWTQDHAELSAAKSAVPKLGASELNTYEEEYGSQAKFAVMCPHTTYWQDIIADVVKRLATSYGTDGVYIDQIAAAGPRPCWDPSHNHSLGGGDHWVKGYAAMLRKVRAAAGPHRVILTESNSEPFMGGVDLLLTLLGFGGGALPGAPADVTGPRIVPAFQAVYGGYVLPVGAEFFRTDFDNPDLFAAKIAVQFVFGAQMGWFSLGGRDNQSPPMGVFEELMDLAHDQEVDYLQQLSQAKRLAGAWFNHGRAMRQPELVTTAVPTAAATKVTSGPAFGPVMVGTWLSADGKELLIAATTVQRQVSARIQTKLDLSHFEFGGHADVAKRHYSAWLMSSSGVGDDKLLGTYTGDAVELDLHLEPRSVALVRISEQAAPAAETGAEVAWV